jgi:hypothetical protein
MQRGVHAVGRACSGGGMQRGEVQDGEVQGGTLTI